MIISQAEIASRINSTTPAYQAAIAVATKEGWIALLWADYDVFWTMVAHLNPLFDNHMRGIDILG